MSTPFTVKQLKALLEDLPESTRVMVESLDCLEDAFPEYIEDTYFKLDGIIQKDLTEDNFGRALNPLKVLLIR